MNVEKPVFILGCPRSGTTIFMNILSFHPCFSWPSQYINRWPSSTRLAVLSRVHDVPVLKNHIKKATEGNLFQGLLKPGIITDR